MTETRKKPDPIDVYVGTRIRLRRNMLGLTQEKLGEQLGITFQQIQKYEKGTNRVGASRLQAIAEIMDVPVSYFLIKVLLNLQRVLLKAKVILWIFALAAKESN
ncbi:helix-turn-helix protein [Bartonella sp. WD12.1]|nr:helix-turn-helix protein [Bartonella sp. WD12.1]